MHATYLYYWSIFTTTNLEFGKVVALLVELLGVQSFNEKTEMRQCRSQHVCLSWLRDIYEQRCEAHLWEYAARAYLLYLVGCTIFAYKSVTSIAVSYISLFRDLGMCGDYVWGVGCLTYIYEQLGDACISHTHQLGGYAKLMQVRLFGTLFVIYILL